MGGAKASFVAFVMASGFYLGASRFLHVEKIPYKLMLGTVGYGLGINISSRVIGDKNHTVYYTKEEHAVLVAHLGPHWLDRIKVIDEEQPSEEK